MTVTTEVLLDANEPGPFELIRPVGASPIVLVCDHASNRMPGRLNKLGLQPEHLTSHIAWDPGAAELARNLSSRLDATLVLSNYSRLVIDCNRPPGHQESIAAESAGIPIPGNTDMSELDILRRRRTLFEPYQQAIADVLGRRKQDALRLLSIHSFTPSLNGSDRPWAVSVCYDKDRTWGEQLLMGLRARTNEEVGDNQPYAVDSDIDYTIPMQGEKRGIPSLMLEFRQDQLADDESVRHWCNIISGILESEL